MRLARGLQADAARLDLREATGRLLLALEPNAEIQMGVLARRIGRDPSTATRFVDRAAAEGLVDRRPGTRDRRRRVVVLTPRGIEARQALAGLQGRRADALAGAILAGTGLGTGQVEWFLGALVEGLSRSEATREGEVSEAG
jgi:DNA-binding MarR family transcriptional regulator